MERNRHYFPLTTDQEVVLFKWAVAAPEQMLNLSVRIDILDEIDEKLFLEAYRLTVERLPYSRLRLHDNEDGELVQYISSMEEQELCDVIDCTGLSDKRFGRQLDKWADTPFPRHARDVQLFDGRLLRKNDGKYCFYFCGHHGIMDIFAVVFFITYLDKVYYALTTGAEMPREGADPEELARKRCEGMKSEKAAGDMEWWLQEFSEEPQFTTVNGADAREWVKGKKYGRDRNLLQMRTGERMFRIPKEFNDRIVATSRAWGFSPYALFALSLHTYLSKVSRQEDVSFLTSIMLRASLAEKSGGMTRVSCIPVRSIVSESETFHDAASREASKNQEYIRHMGGSAPDKLVEEQFHLPPHRTYTPVMMAYVPYIDYAKIHLRVRAGTAGAGIAPAAMYMLLMPIDDSGDLWTVYKYAKGYYKSETVEKFHNFMLRFLEAGLDNPEATIGELTDRCM